MLGGLEQKIMEVLWCSTVPLKPSEVLSKIEGKNAYTTIMTVLKRMTDKKIVKRELKGNAYFYTSAQEKNDFATTALEDLFRRLYSSYGEHTLSTFKKVTKDLGLRF